MATLTYRKITCPIIPGRDILSQLLDAGAEISYICMAGSCGTCAVGVVAGGEHLEPMTQAERSRMLVRDGSRRLACQAVCLGSGDVIVRQP